MIEQKTERGGGGDYFQIYATAYIFPTHLFCTLLHKQGNYDMWLFATFVIDNVFSKTMQGLKVEEGRTTKNMWVTITSFIQKD